jgi:Tfp pilus assembly protein PilW
VKIRAPRRRQGGLTIVELLITIVVASMLSVATFTFFAGQQRIYDTQTELLNMQQNLWAAMETLSRYARAGGAGMSGCIRSDPPGVDEGDPGPGADVMPQIGLRVWRNGVFSRIPPLWIRNGTAGAPDMITVAYGEGASGSFRDAALRNNILAGQSTANIVTTLGESAGFVADEFALLVDTGQANLDRGCTLFQITGVNLGTDTLLHSGATSLWNTIPNVAQMVPFTYAGDPNPNTATGGIRRFGQLTFVQFAVDTVSNPPTLTMNVLTGAEGPQVLAEGIEDMQVAYACDGGDGSAADGDLTEAPLVANRDTDEWIYNHEDDVEYVACKRPDAIRITLMVRSTNTDTNLGGITTNAKPGAEDGRVGDPDTFRHRVATTTVYPRN